MRPIGVQPPSCSAPGAALTSGCFGTVAGASWLCRMLLAFQTSKEAWQISPRLFNSSVMHPCYLLRADIITRLAAGPPRLASNQTLAASLR